LFSKEKAENICFAPITT